MQRVSVITGVLDFLPCGFDPVIMIVGLRPADEAFRSVLKA